MLNGKKKNQLLLVVLILFILEVISFPFVAGFTYADKNEQPNQILTYTKGNLAWDSASNVLDNGVAELSMFDAMYENVQSDSGDKVIAPGTQGKNIVRLQNDESGNVEYTVVLYQIKENEKIPVVTDLTCDNSYVTDDYLLPDGVSKDSVIKAVTGTLSGNERKNLEINWNWTYEDLTQQDETDTMLGNIAASKTQDVTVGVYVVVEDNNEYVRPNPPKTGDNSNMMMWICLMSVSFVVLVFLVGQRKREKKEN